MDYVNIQPVVPNNLLYCTSFYSKCWMCLEQNTTARARNADFSGGDNSMKQAEYWKILVWILSSTHVNYVG